MDSESGGDMEKGLHPLTLHDISCVSTRRVVFKKSTDFVYAELRHLKACSTAQKINAHTIRPSSSISFVGHLAAIILLFRRSI